MSHGRFFFAVLVSLLAMGGQAFCQAADGTSGVRLSWIEPNHPSGIYHVKSDATLTVVADNTSAQPVELSGEIEFGARADAGFKPLSVTPVARAVLAPGQRARIPITLTFAAAGPYELRLKQGADTTPIAGLNGLRLHCIFAPRIDAKKDAPWLTLLPPNAVTVPGMLSDYAQQTSVRRFVVDERFSYDPAANVGLGFGASTGASAKQVDALLAEAVKGKLQFTLRVATPVSATPENVVETINAFRKYIDDAVRRSKGSLTAIAMVPDLRERDELSDAQRSLFRSFYIAGYEAAKRADKNVAMVGPGSAAQAAEIFRVQAPKTSNVFANFDALALSNASLEPLIAAELLGERKLPLHMLPPMPVEAFSVTAWAPAAAAMAARATVVAIPPPDLDNGVTAHLLGGATFVERLQLALPSKTAGGEGVNRSSVPFVGLFQGDGYSVAAIAGFGAGTDLDGLYPSLARSPTEVELVKATQEPAYPNLEVGDDSHAMRVVDSRGAPVECRLGGGGDHLFVPAQGRMVYLLEANTAEELAGSLRPSVPNHLPVFEVTAVRKAGAGGVMIRLHNISAAGQGGSVRVLATGEAKNVIAGEEEFALVLPGASGEILVEGADGDAVTVEITTGGTKRLIQRTTVSLPR